MNYQVCRRVLKECANGEFASLWDIDGEVRPAFEIKLLYDQKEYNRDAGERRTGTERYLQQESKREP